MAVNRLHKNKELMYLISSFSLLGKRLYRGLRRCG